MLRAVRCALCAVRAASASVHDVRPSSPSLSAGSRLAENDELGARTTKNDYGTVRYSICFIIMQPPPPRRPPPRVCARPASGAAHTTSAKPGTFGSAAGQPGRTGTYVRTYL